jgi:hypothetical protein
MDISNEAYMTKACGLFSDALPLTICRSYCQRAHWKQGGHRRFCLPKELRQLSPSPARARPAEDEAENYCRHVGSSAPSLLAPTATRIQLIQSGLARSGIGDGGGDNQDDYECAICLDPLPPPAAPAGLRCLLPCGHVFHGACVAGLRAFGVTNACPLCRAELPPGPARLYEQACRKYVALEQKATAGRDVSSGGGSGVYRWFAALSWPRRWRCGAARRRKAAAGRPTT